MSRCSLNISSIRSIIAVVSFDCTKHQVSWFVVALKAPANDRAFGSLNLRHDKGFSLSDVRSAAMLFDRKRSEFVYKEQCLGVSQRSQRLNENFYLRSIFWVRTCENLSSSPHRISGLMNIGYGSAGRDRHPQLAVECFSQACSSPTRPIDVVGARLAVEYFQYLCRVFVCPITIRKSAPFSRPESSLAMSPVRCFPPLDRRRRNANIGAKRGLRATCGFIVPKTRKNVSLFVWPQPCILEWGVRRSLGGAPGLLAAGSKSIRRSAFFSGEPPTPPTS